MHLAPVQGHGAAAGLRELGGPVAPAAQGGDAGRGIRGKPAPTNNNRAPLRGRLRRVACQDDHRERLLVSYNTSEGWKCVAEVHRFHVIGAGAHKNIIEGYQVGKSYG
jgi:hypothetical protein